MQIVPIPVEYLYICATAVYSFYFNFKTFENISNVFNFIYFQPRNWKLRSRKWTRASFGGWWMRTKWQRTNFPTESASLLPMLSNWKICWRIGSRQMEVLKGLRFHSEIWVGNPWFTFNCSNMTYYRIHFQNSEFQLFLPGYQSIYIPN